MRAPPAADEDDQQRNRRETAEIADTRVRFVCGGPGVLAASSAVVFGTSADAEAADARAR